MNEFGTKSLGGEVSEERPARPWDVFNKTKRDTPPHVAEARMEICRSCEEFLKPIQLCNVCKCFMPAKTILSNASCPIHKWRQISFSITEPDNVHDDGLPRKA